MQGDRRSMTSSKAGPTPEKTITSSSLIASGLDGLYLGVGARYFPFYSVSISWGFTCTVEVFIAGIQRVF
ncbi:hypothetical protein SDJN02_14039, partial [Cucurbita argyrosperma subsp. argyrosperma]